MSQAREKDLEYCRQVAEFLATTSLPLTPSLPPTLGDGNCWYRAMATQVQLAKIPGKPPTHTGLREAVADHLKMLPKDIKERILALLLGGRRRGMAGLSSVYRRDGQWLDDDGVMALATADFLGRDIVIYGVRVEGSKRPFSEIRVEGGGGADAESQPPLTVFLHASHYQSLKEDTKPRVRTSCVRIEKLDTNTVERWKLKPAVVEKRMLQEAGGIKKKRVSTRISGIPGQEQQGSPPAALPWVQETTQGKMKDLKTIKEMPEDLKLINRNVVRI